MIRKLLRAGLILVVVLAAAAGGLYLVGVRMVMDGGAGIHFAFVKSADEQAEEIARHREAQRAQGPAPAAVTAAEPIEPIEPAEPAEPARPALPALPAGGDWPDFRGPARDGHYRATPIRTDWPASGLTPLWKQPVGGGYASFVTAGGQAFTIEQRAREEVVAAYDVMTGRELWTSSWTARFSETMGGDGPRATPTWSNGRVFALGGEGELRALDARDGRVLWRTNILADAGADNLQWGMSGAPLIVDDTVVVTPGGSGGRSIVAYDAATGRRVWSALDDMTSYSSPMLVTIGGVRQILYFTASRLVAIATGGGRELWSHPWVTSPAVNASQPLLVGDNRLFISTGYGKGATVIELTRAGDAFTVREVWRNIRMKNQFTSSVLHEGHIYGLDEAILACMDAATGELKWKGGRYGYGQLMLAGGHLIVMTEGGDMALVRATPAKHEEVSRFKVFDARTWNHPAIANGILLVRNLEEMAAFDLRPATR